MNSCEMGAQRRLSDRLGLNPEPMAQLDGGVQSKRTCDAAQWRRLDRTERIICLRRDDDGMT